jgi:hypothetical protein
MTAPPEQSDAAWRDQPIDQLCEILPRIGHTAPNVRRMAERSFVVLHGSFRRHPARQLFADAFADDRELDVLRMYRGVRCPTLLLGAPSRGPRRCWACRSAG